MKAVLKFIAPLFCFCLMLSGCSLWMDGEYSSVTPNHSQRENFSEDVLLVGSYLQVCDALAEMVEDGAQESIFFTNGLSNNQVDNYMDMAVDYILQMNPVGAYAVREITYDIGTNMGKQAIAVNISYNHNRSEILRIKQAKDMNDVQSLICGSLESCASGLVVMVDSYQPQDLIQFVEDYVSQNPQTCMETPQVSVSLFPEIGQERVIEIVFTYQHSRDALRSMQQSVSDIFKSAHFYINPSADNSEKYSQLYSFLMERYDYTIETSITPAYSLLRHGVGDSKAFATVYAAICRQAGIDCQVVSGTKAGEAWHWNVLEDSGIYYHLDLLECNAVGAFSVKTEEEMVGYVWDYSAFGEQEE